MDSSFSLLQLFDFIVLILGQLICLLYSVFVTDICWDIFVWFCSKCFKQKLASLQLDTEPFEVQHYMLLLTLLNAESESDRLLLELYSLAHSQPARLYVLMKLNRTLRELLFRLIGLDDEVSPHFPANS